MPDLVCTGATLKCSFGTVLATFTATAAKVSAGAPAGVVTDTSTANVRAFGLCQSPNNPQVQAASEAVGALTPQPCQPVLVGDWTPGSAQVTVGATAALDRDSQCSCAWGGAITVADAGQTAVTLS
jgi:Domain of unknown function (DUF4280)